MSPQPHVWSIFTKIRHSKELKLRIEKLPDDKFEEIFDFLFKFYVTDEPVHKATNMSQQPDGLEEYKKIFIMSLQGAHYEINVCYLEDNGRDKIIGMSTIMMKKKEQSHVDLETLKSMTKSEELRTVLKLAILMDENCNFFEMLNVDTYYRGRGVVVDKDYRGLGIAGELLKVRLQICKEHKVPVTVGWMTSIGTQKAAAKLGWETIHEVSYKELENHSGLKFGDENLVMKLMAGKVV